MRWVYQQVYKDILHEAMDNIYAVNIRTRAGIVLYRCSDQVREGIYDEIHAVINPVLVGITQGRIELDPGYFAGLR